LGYLGWDEVGWLGCQVDFPLAGGFWVGRGGNDRKAGGWAWNAVAFIMRAARLLWSV